jgi:hypothetical protein
MIAKRTNNTLSPTATSTALSPSSKHIGAIGDGEAACYAAIFGELPLKLRCLFT